jgi:[glutamine synthetase] adenylyltransferase / [glutamine synthetase]-adenylyl-L-tyrosine phosphorylase
VREIYDRVIHAQKPLYDSPRPLPEPVEEVEARAGQQPDALLDQRAPRLAAVVAARGLNRGRERFEHFLEKAFANPEMLDRLDGDGKLAAGVLDIFEHSPYFADELLRYPELLDEIGAALGLEGEPLEDGGALRRFYRRQMLRIQSESMLAAAPIFATLRKTSALADSVIDAAYRIAVMDSLPPANHATPAIR